MGSLKLMQFCPADFYLSYSLTFSSSFQYLLRHCHQNHQPILMILIVFLMLPLSHLLFIILLSQTWTLIPSSFYFWLFLLILSLLLTCKFDLTLSVLLVVVFMTFIELSSNRLNIALIQVWWTWWQYLLCLLCLFSLFYECNPQDGWDT